MHHFLMCAVYVVKKIRILISMWCTYEQGQARFDSEFCTIGFCTHGTGCTSVGRREGKSWPATLDRIGKIRIQNGGNAAYQSLRSASIGSRFAARHAG